LWHSTEIQTKMMARTTNFTYPPTNMVSYEQIFENNRKWIAEKTANEKDFFEKLAKDQTPEYLYIGCSDSRVTAEDLMGAAPGEVFIHRNVANVVASVDLNMASVINYAVRHLKVKRVVVCGHYGCGGVKAAMQPRDLGILNPWLRNIRDVYRLHKRGTERHKGRRRPLRPTGRAQRAGTMRQRDQNRRGAATLCGRGIPIGAWLGV
jgi:carbonic anhydrase